MKNNYNQIINELTDRELTLHLYATQILLLGVSLLLNYILFDDFSFWQNIILLDYQIIKIGVTVGILVVIMDIILMKWLPASFYDDGGINDRIFRNKRTLHILLITLLVSISEEILFRGIIQTKVGVVWASLIFASIHYRYLFKLFLFINIILLSFLIGYIYHLTNNLAVTIVMHFVIDFLLGLHIKRKNLKKDYEQEGSFNE